MPTRCDRCNDSSLLHMIMGPVNAVFNLPSPGKIYCRECRGNGLIDDERCETCKGTGKELCPKCRGEGYLTEE